MSDLEPRHPASIRKPRRVVGRSLAFRDVGLADAAFLVELRTDPEKGRFLSATAPDVRAQTEWLERYATSEGQAYFIIEDHGGDSLGCVRLYDARGDSFCWGSWILRYGAPQTAALESALMVYALGIDHFGFHRAHFDVRKENERVWTFHERFGARRIGETGADYLYTLDGPEIGRSRARYAKFLPEPVTVEWPA